MDATTERNIDKAMCDYSVSEILDFIADNLDTTAEVHYVNKMPEEYNRFITNASIIRYAAREIKEWE